MVDVDVKSVDAVWRRGTELQKEIEQSKQKYDELIKQQNNMPGKDKAAEAVIKYYLFQLEKLKSELPYDAMGCESAVSLLVLQEFQKETIAEDILEFLGHPDNFSKEELLKEVQKFSIIHLDSRGLLLYQDLLIKGR
ncbi:MAG: hypothetical protein Q4F83_07075 [Eubacteriales bacterium]|nr:hypothetical protein [Eubacteriales bacterium]